MVKKECYWLPDHSEYSLLKWRMQNESEASKTGIVLCRKNIKWLNEYVA